MKRIFTVLLFLLIHFTSVAGDEGKMFSLYPIPVKTNKLFVERNTDNKDCMKITRVELRNLIGKRLQALEFESNAMKVMFEEMDTYPNGIYVVLAMDAYGKIIETAKFIINK